MKFLKKTFFAQLFVILLLFTFSDRAFSMQQQDEQDEQIEEMDLRSPKPPVVGMLAGASEVNPLVLQFGMHLFVGPLPILQVVEVNALPSVINCSWLGNGRSLLTSLFGGLQEDQRSLVRVFNVPNSSTEEKELVLAQELLPPEGVKLVQASEKTSQVFCRRTVQNSEVLCCARYDEQGTIEEDDIVQLCNFGDTQGFMNCRILDAENFLVMSRVDDDPVKYTLLRLGRERRRNLFLGEGVLPDASLSPNGRYLTLVAESQVQDGVPTLRVYNTDKCCSECEHLLDEDSKCVAHQNLGEQAPGAMCLKEIPLETAGLNGIPCKVFHARKFDVPTARAHHCFPVCWVPHSQYLITPHAPARGDENLGQAVLKVWNTELWTVCKTIPLKLYKQQDNTWASTKELEGVDYTSLANVRYPKALACSYDGKLLAVQYSDEVEIWNIWGCVKLTSIKEVHDDRDDENKDICFVEWSPRFPLLAVGLDGSMQGGAKEVKVYDLDQHSPRPTIQSLIRRQLGLPMFARRRVMPVQEEPDVDDLKQDEEDDLSIKTDASEYHDDSELVDPFEMSVPSVSSSSTSSSEEQLDSSDEDDENSESGNCWDCCTIL